MKLGGGREGDEFRDHGWELQRGNPLRWKLVEGSRSAMDQKAAQGSRLEIPQGDRVSAAKVSSVADAGRNRSRENSMGGHEPLPRPGDTLVNRVAYSALARRAIRDVSEEDVDRWLGRSILAIEKSGGKPEAVVQLRKHRNSHWTISRAPAPKEVWCGEVLWPVTNQVEQIPEVVIYPNSPWGKLPGGVVSEMASQTGIDHIVSHLYHYFANQPYGEEVSCSDQVRFAWTRGTLVDRVGAVAILGGLRLHKQIAFMAFARQLKLPLDSQLRG